MDEKLISEFFIEKFFSYIDERTKLKTIKYNKKLQRILNISLVNYNFSVENILFLIIMEMEKNMMVIMMH